MKNHKVIYLLGAVGIAAIVGILFYAYGTEFKNSAAPEDTSFVSENDLPEGVALIEQDGRKIVKDENNGVEVEIKDEWEVLYADTTTIYVGESLVQEAGASEGFELIVHKLGVSEEMTLEPWLNNWIRNSNCPRCYSAPRRIQDDLYVVEDMVALGDMVLYFYSLNNNIYQITVFNKTDDINDIITKIKFGL